MCFTLTPSSHENERMHWWLCTLCGDIPSTYNVSQNMIHMFECTYSRFIAPESTRVTINNIRHLLYAFPEQNATTKNNLHGVLRMHIEVKLNAYLTAISKTQHLCKFILNYIAFHDMCETSLFWKFRALDFFRLQPNCTILANLDESMHALKSNKTTCQLLYNEARQSLINMRISTLCVNVCDIIWEYAPLCKCACVLTKIDELQSFHWIILGCDSESPKNNSRHAQCMCCIDTTICGNQKHTVHDILDVQPCDNCAVKHCESCFVPCDGCQERSNDKRTQLCVTCIYTCISCQKKMCFPCRLDHEISCCVCAEQSCGVKCAGCMQNICSSCAWSVGALRCGLNRDIICNQCCTPNSVMRQSNNNLNTKYKSMCMQCCSMMCQKCHQTSKRRKKK